MNQSFSALKKMVENISFPAEALGITNPKGIESDETKKDSDEKKHSIHRIMCRPRKPYQLDSASA